MGMIHIEEIGQRKLDRVSAVLRSFPGGAEKAVHNALSRAAASGMSKGPSFGSAVYNLSTAKFRGLCNITKTGGGLKINVIFGGSSIPIIEFNPKGGQQGPVTFSVKRGDFMTLRHSWLGNGYGHGVWERVGKPRFPLEEMKTMGTGVMMSDEAVADPTAEHMQDVFDTRLEHEITRILNGW